MKITTILVPTDFSADAEKALSTAVDIAKLVGARIVILHAYHVNIPMVSTLDSVHTLPQNFYDELRYQAMVKVENVAKELTAEGIEAAGVALSEPASVAIVAQAESLPADLIVMGTRGLTGLKHVVLGSVADRVVRMAPCPVMTVKARI